MEAAMTAPSINAVWLRLRIALAAWSPVAVGAALLCVLALVALAWVVPAREELERQRTLARQVAALPAPSVASAQPATDEHNLAVFYGVLGERRYAERQVKTLFGLAAQTGLVLHQGEYQAAYDRNAGLHTYQVTLPVKGSYGAIWQFALLALRAIPFASLDEISFKRDAIGQANVEARLRLTLYLAERPPGVAP
jgi:hypothetical protein